MPIQSSNPTEKLELVYWQKGGLNQSTERSTIDDSDLWWLENYFPVATGELRSAWGPSAPIYTAPAGTTILRMFNSNISGPPLGFAFLSNGHVQQFLLNAPYTVTDLGAVWQPVAPHYYAALKLWRPTFVGATAGESGGLLIGSPQGLYAWDGATLTSPGQAPPLWLTDGATTDASGNPLVMPSGLPGIFSLEVYNQRLWVLGQTVMSFSAPSNGADFSAAGGGGSFGWFGDQLTVSWTDLQATAGFLYVFGDSNTSWISNIQLVGSASPTTSPSITNPFTTQFQFSNYNPQVGQAAFRPTGEWLQAVTTVNMLGTYLIDGSGQATWLSEKIAKLWDTLDYRPFEPTQTPAHIFGQRWLLTCGTFTDPFGVTRSLLVCWNGQIWTVATQGYALTQVDSYEQGGVIHAYGTDGTVIVQLFAQPDTSLVKRLATKAYSGKSPLWIKDFKRLFVQLTDLAGQAEGSFLTGEFSTLGGGVPNGSEQVSFEVKPNQTDMVGHGIAGAGLFGWLDLVGQSPDYVISRILIGYDDRTEYGA